MKLFGKNKKTLSYSAISLWTKSREMYRKRYFEGIKFSDTVFTIAGKEIEKQIYAGKYPEIPFWGGEQTKLQINIEGIPIIGYLDSFHKEELKFLDYKTSITPWTQFDVQKLEQLAFYNFMIKKIYGAVEPICNLVWLETKMVPSKGLLSNGDSLCYTGKFEIFKRRIIETDRKRIEKWILKSEEEISDDYTNWLEERAKLSPLPDLGGRTGTLLT